MPSAERLKLPEDCFGTTLSSGEKRELEDLLQEYSNVFPRSELDLGRTQAIYHRIDTGDAKPVRRSPYRTPVHLPDTMKNQIHEMLEKDVIERSTSPWAAPVLLVKKKDNSWRFVCDFRGLNDVTKKDSYPLPRIDDTLDALAGSNIFSVLDLASGYWQTEVLPEHREKTAFVTNQGLFQFKVLPFGLCNAPATFQRLLEFLFAGENWMICLIYLDDIIVFARSFAEHHARLRQVLSKLQAAGLKVKLKKCRFGCEEVLYLGHLISKHGVAPDPEKTSAVLAFPTPTTVTEVKSFVGLCSYYRRFVPAFAEIASPLHRLTQKGARFLWSPECENAFQRLKTLLTSSPVLALPDFQIPFRLSADASEIGLGAVLSQMKNGQEHVIAYASRALSKSERNYSATQRETLALVWSTEHFRPYLYGVPFKLVTDHNPLCWLRKMKEPRGMFARWLLKLEEYSYDVEYKPGKLHQNADSLSRAFKKETEVQVTKSAPDNLPKISATILSPAYTRGEFSTLQKADVVLSKVLLGLELEAQGGKWIRPTIQAELSYWRQKRRLRVIDGVLHRSWQKRKGDTPSFKVVVPELMQPELLRAAHDDPASGHMAVARTLAKLQVRFYWLGMCKDVEEWCKVCVDCATKKSPTTGNRAPLISMPMPDRPFEMIAMDVLGPLPTTDKGNKYILVITDYFSKWPEAIPLPNQEAETVAKALVERIICQFGIPKILLTDQGRNFESAVFKEICRLLQITKSRTSAYHPQCDGQTERFNKTLVTILSMYVSDHQKDWDDWIPYALLAYRTSRHESTQMTPASVILSFDPTLPLDILTEEVPSDKTAEPTFPHAMKTSVLEAIKQLKENVKSAQHKQKKYYDQKAVDILFSIGDRVWVYTPKRKKGLSPKLLHPWHGPYTVISQVTPVTYRLRPDHGRGEVVAHHNRLKRCYSQPMRPLPRSNAAPHQSALQDPNDRCITGPIPEQSAPSSPRTEVFNVSMHHVPALEPLPQPSQVCRRSLRNKRVPDRYGFGVPYRNN